jgi:hypothetical protein
MAPTSAIMSGRQNGDVGGGWPAAGQPVVAVVVRQSSSRLWAPHSSFHSAWQARSPRRMNRPPPWMVLTWPKTGSMERLRRA